MHSAKQQDTRLTFRSWFAFLYTNNEISERECLRKKTFKIALKKKNCTEKIKYLGINLTKEVKDLYTENYKILISG